VAPPLADTRPGAGESAERSRNEVGEGRGAEPTLRGQSGIAAIA
jgi:hypothetical protein